jgi:hypothetical protein
MGNATYNAILTVTGADISGFTGPDINRVYLFVVSNK